MATTQQERRSSGRSTGNRSETRRSQRSDRREQRRDEKAARKQRRSREEEGQGGGFDLGRAIGFTLLGLILVAYFAWLCAEMGSPVPGGQTMLILVFGAILLAGVAGAIPLAIRGLRDRGNDEE